MEIVEKAPGRHYAWGDGCDGWHLVRTTTLSVIEERMPPGTSEVRHYHRRADQFFYVLHGVLSFCLATKEVELRAGQGLHVTAGEIHQVRNRSASDVAFLVVSNPPSHGDRLIAE
jgi:mannose-6-phosphate isomerase-like protein (cupin superfamily)